MSLHTLPPPHPHDVALLQIQSQREESQRFLDSVGRLSRLFGRMHGQVWPREGVGKGVKLLFIMWMNEREDVCFPLFQCFLE